jgi:polysaccharide biosynthesis transport protein
MLGKKSLERELLPKSLHPRRIQKAGGLFLCGLAALSLISAVGRPATADDDANAAKVNAKALLRVAMSQKTVIPPNEQNLQAEFGIFKNTQHELLRCPFVLRAALEKPVIADLPIIKSQKSPVEWLRRNLQVTFPSNAEIMQVSFLGASPKEQATLVNAVVDAYMEKVVDAEREKIQDRLNELRRIQVNKVDEVKTSLSDLRRMADMLGTSESDILNIKQKNLLDELSILRSEWIRSQSELNRMNAQLASQKALLEAEENAPISDIECELFASSDFILKKLQEEIIPRKIADQKNKNELDRLQKEYVERIEKIREEIKRKRQAAIEKEIKKIEAAISILNKQHEITTEDVKQLRKDADRFGMSSIDMQMRRSAIANANKSLDAITAELEKLQIEARTTPRVTVLEKAQVPE